MAYRWAAHEFLETQEALRSTIANIELHSFFVEMTADYQLKTILTRHIQRMMNSYQQGLSMLQNKNQSPAPLQIPQPHMIYQATVGLNNPVIPAPNPRAVGLSDMTMSTVVLNQHKAGSSMAMLWANECVDPQVRSYHVACANDCQQMAYEIWQYMNQKGFYQSPQLEDHTMNTMIQAFQTQPTPMTPMMM